MLTYYAANIILNNLVGRNSMTSLTTQSYIGLSYTAPNRNGTNITEPDKATTGYERVLIGYQGQSISYKMNTSTEAETANNTTIFFPKAIDNYPSNVTHFIIFNHETSTGYNNVIAYGELKTPIKPNRNEVPLIERGDLILAIDKDLSNN